MGCYASKDAAAGNQAVDRVVKRLEEQLVPAGPPNGKDQQQQGAAALDGYPFYGDLEAARLKALTDCRVLDTPAEARFDNITKLLQGIFQVPMALVSLIDHDRLVFHSIAGPAGPGGRRIHSFCDESLKAANPRMMVVEDTLQDARFQHSQFVEGEPHVRFYSGAPLVSSEGYVMGSLGILDLVPRKFSADLYNMICNFAELVVREMERDKIAELQRLEAARLAEAQRSLVRALSCFDEAIVLVDATSPTDWKIKYANGAWSKLTGLSEKASTETPFWDLVRLSDPKQDLTRIQDTISAREPFTLRLAVQNNSNGGTEGSLVLRFRPATNDHLSLQAPLIGIPNFVEPTTSKEAYPSIHYFAVAQAYVPETPKGVLPNGIAATRTSSNTLSSASSLPLSLSSRYGSVSGRGSGGSGGSGAAHACFGLDRPETLKELKLGPMLGKGSYGKVYRGLWHGAQVAVKVMDSFVDLDPATGNPIPQELAKGPMLEALLSKELPHPHIVQTYEFATRVESESDQIPEDTPILGHPGSGDTDSPFGSAGAQEGGAVAALPPRQLQRMWIIQEFCNHGTLYDATDRGWLRAKRDLDGSTNYLAVLQTAQEIASAMQYLHSRGIVHGDLTGNNVLLKSSSKDQRRFIAMVGDFGLSRVLNQDDPIATQSLGTVTHMPPEALIHGEVTKSVDVYSMGVLLWELYCHQRAWCGRVPSQVVYMVATLGRKLELPEHAPAPYKELATACMHSEREKRPSFEEVFSRLETMLAEERLVCGAGTQQELP